eukprot:scaffold1951_cov258-Pinguiococcus_pyrenoidosus.AAC.17
MSTAKKAEIPATWPPTPGFLSFSYTRWSRAGRLAISDPSEEDRPRLGGGKGRTGRKFGVPNRRQWDAGRPWHTKPSRPSTNQPLRPTGCMVVPAYAYRW